MNPIFSAVAVLSIAAIPASAQDGEKRKKPPHEKGMHQKMPELTKLIAMIHPVGDSSVNGSVSFEKVGDGVKVTANIYGLQPNSKHGIHVHEFGDLGSADVTSAGGHFNPEGHDHALPDKDMRHAGDLGNLEADGEGKAILEMTVDNFRLGHGPHGILGRAVIIHAKEDDGGQPTGNAGDRIGAGVIGISRDGVSMKKGMRDRKDNSADSAPEPSGADAQNTGNRPAVRDAGTGGPDSKPGTGNPDNTPKADDERPDDGRTVTPPEKPGNKPGTATGAGE